MYLFEASCYVYYVLSNSPQSTPMIKVIGSNFQKRKLMPPAVAPGMGSRRGMLIGELSRDFTLCALSSSCKIPGANVPPKFLLCPPPTQNLTLLGCS